MLGFSTRCLLWLPLITSTAVPLRAQPAPLVTGPGAASARDRSITCLIDAIVYEAGLEPIEGQQAVAQVVINRLHDPTFPKTVCGVVYQGAERRSGCQFTFTCDGSLRRPMSQRMAATARGIAEAALNGALPDRIANATFYHADYVAPRWAPRLTRVGQIGAHIFYRAGSGQALDDAHIPFPMAALDTSHRARPSRTRALQPFAPWGLPMTGGEAPIKNTGSASFD